MARYDTIRWGIIGPGSIAHKFAEGLQALPDARLVAVGSRDRARADAFAEKFGAPHRHAGYEALVQDGDVDAVYVATPHPMHRDACLLALRAGKAVLCEKPFTVNAGELEQIVNAARERKQFAMEAHWSRFFPAMGRVRELLRDGAIGQPQLLEADFGFHSTLNPKSRLYAPELAGGALLDVGCYTLSLASMVFGAPDRVAGTATIGSTGVDEQAAIALGYANGAVASLNCTVRAATPHVAVINGTEGRITLPTHWWRAERIVVSRRGKEDETIDLPAEGTGFNYEAAEVGHCLREGKLESDIMPLDESLAIMRVMDTLRAQWGVRYPMEARG